MVRVNSCKSFHEGLLHAMNCNNLGLLTSPPQTYYSFFPNTKTKKNPDKTTNEKGGSEAKDNVRQFAQIIVTGRQPAIPPHSKLSFKPCSDFLQGKCSKPTAGPNKCQYAHSLFPRDYPKPDRVKMCRWVDGANHIEWASGPKQAMEKMKASGQF